MHCTKLNQTISMVLKHGPGALKVKFDVNLDLRFGPCSAPYIFNSVAMLEWILLNRYNIAELMHYLSDFLRKK